MIDGGAHDLDQDLVACNRRRRYIVEYQLPTEFQQADSFHAISPLGSLVSLPIWPRVEACPVREFREPAAELAFSASDIGAIPHVLEPLKHQCHFIAVLPDLFDWRLCERNRPAQRLRQYLRRPRHRSYVTGEV